MISAAEARVMSKNILDKDTKTALNEVFESVRRVAETGRYETCVSLEHFFSSTRQDTASKLKDLGYQVRESQDSSKAGHIYVAWYKEYL